jgi:dTDP-4-amino-4,6-dideoxygalactose transaminase
MESKRIFLSPPFLAQKEQVYVNQILASNWVAPTGPHITKFENEIGKYIKTDFCTATVTGTSAIHLALIVLGIKPGDEVVVPTFTFAATVNPILYLGAKPVFIESESQTWGMCPDTLRDKLSKNGKKPKAIIVVHPYGNTAKIVDLLHVANEFSIPVIEDAAAALGSTYKGKHVGTFGLMGAFSFNGNKIITTSQGGALISNNQELIAQARQLSMQSKIPGIGFEHDAIGYNYRMSNVLAGIGLAQLETIETRVQRKREVFEMYRNAFQNTPISLMDEIPEARYSRWLTNLQFENEKQVLAAANALEKENIECRRLWKPLHTQTFCKEFEYFGNEASMDFYKKGLSLPSGLELSNEQINRIAEIVNKAIAQ